MLDSFVLGRVNDKIRSDHASVKALDILVYPECSRGRLP